MFLCLFLFLFGINFMLYGDTLLLVPFGVSVIKKKRIRVNITTFLLIAFVVAYLIPEFIIAQQPTYRLLFVPIAFLLGYNYYESVSEKDIVSCYLAVAFGMATHSILNFVMTVAKTGFRFSNLSIFEDFWSRTTTTTTGMMSNFVLFLPLLIFAMVQRKKYYALIPVVALGVFMGVITGNRTTLFLFVVATVVGMIIVFVNGQRKLGFALVAIIAGLLLFLLLAYLFNWFNLKSMYDNSYLVYRFNINRANGESLLETQRWDTKGMYISKMLDYPWGGGKLREVIGGYAHDIWLDTWSWGGCVAFIILIGYLALFIYRMIRFIRMAEELSTKVLFSGYLVIILIQYLIEPIIQGAPWLFISAALFDGMISRYLAQKTNEAVRRV